MKRFVLSVFLLFAGLSVFAQTYSDWEKVFSENKKDNIEETFSTVGSFLDKSDKKEMMNIFELYFEKCEIKYIEEIEHNDVLDYKTSFNAEYKSYILTNPNGEKNIAIFLDYIKKNNFVFLDVSDIKPYDLSKIIPIVPIRNITILPTEYEGKLIQLQCDYKYTSNDIICFEYFDESDNTWKDFFAYYNTDTAKQLLYIQKQKFNNKYALFGKIKNRHFVVEYMEHID